MGKVGNMKIHLRVAGTVIFLAMLPAASRAQAAKAPNQVYTGNIGAGFSLTGGNTDTTNFNLTGELTRDPKKKNVIKLSGLYLRSDADNLKTADRLTLGFRDEYTVSPRFLAYGAFGYLRDPFKEISYLMNPQGGIGFKPILTENADLTLSAGAGAVWEKNPGIDVHTSGTVNAGESFDYKLSDRARITQKLNALWKTEDFDDAFYRFEVSLVTSIISKSEVKISFVDDFKNVTPNPTIKKNDTAFLVSFLYKF